MSTNQQLPFQGHRAWCRASDDPTQECNCGLAGALHHCAERMRDLLVEATPHGFGQRALDLLREWENRKASFHRRPDVEHGAEPK